MCFIFGGVFTQAGFLLHSVGIGPFKRLREISKVDQVRLAYDCHTGPVKAFRLMFRCCRLDKYLPTPKSPVNWLFATFNSRKSVNVEIVAGSVPLNLLLSSATNCNVGSANALPGNVPSNELWSKYSVLDARTPGGTVPLNELLDRISSSNLGSVLNPDGIDPDNRLFVTVSETKDKSWPNSGGIDPDRLFSSKNRYCNEEIAPISRGIEPDS